MEPWHLLGCFILGGVLCYVVLRVIDSMARGRRLRKLVQERREVCAEYADVLRDSLSKDRLIFLDEERTIVDLPFLELLDRLKNETLTPTTVLRAYQLKALKASEGGVNSVVQFIKEAQGWATALEAEYGRDRKPKPPLYGIPVSLKESIMVKGYDATRGYVHCLGQLSTDDAMVVAMLKKLGAVPFVRTNVPQTLLAYSCSNPIYGRTSHPLKPSRTCGGSTGGEASLLFCLGSILGIGGDVGGSIRVPAHFCGVAGFKPTSTRISQIGSLPSIPGRPLMAATLGPMARDAETLAYFMKHLLCDELFFNDPYMSPIPFRDEVYTDRRPLTIGYYESDSLFPAIAACRRVVLKTKEMLESAGHRLVPFNPPDPARALRLIIGAATVDGGQYVRDNLKKDLVDPCMRLANFIYTLPFAIRHVIAALLKLVDPRTSMIISSFPPDTSALRQIYEDISKYRLEFVKAWRDAGIDALICPPCPVVAMPDGVMGSLMSTATYPAIYNLVDFPAGVVPCSLVRPEDEVSVQEEYVVKDIPSYLVRKYSGTHSSSVGLPVGLQVVALHNQDEMCLRVMVEVERLWPNPDMAI